MNRWRFSFLTTTAIFLLFLHIPTLTSGSAIRQRSECGPHPLIALVAASRPSGSVSTSTSLNEVLRAVRADPDVWSELQVLIRRYDDCVRAGDGLHYKRNTSPFVSQDLLRNIRNFSFRLPNYSSSSSSSGLTETKTMKEIPVDDFLFYSQY